MTAAAMPPVALTIAGSDSGGGAGIQADLKTFAALGVFGTSAITAITAQNTVGVRGVSMVPVAMVVAQIEAVADDLPVRAVKTGMLGDASIVEAVAEALARRALGPVVVDPVMVAKSGDRLLDPGAVAAVRARLLPLATVVTPNLPEAEVLCGFAIRSTADAREAARRLHGDGASAVIVKGGHGAGETLIDLLFDGTTFHEFPTPRIATANTHGTGCTFASAVAAWLALGASIDEATARAQHYVAGAIRHALPLGAGHGPLRHDWMQATAR